ncbi:MAG TPA: TIGR03960 family B12-binding radical SAM protein [Armatimonadota bacterium]|jgi:radical SAM family uncharacterized protein/radical SAM-linked protein
MPITYDNLKARLHDDVLSRVQKPSRYLGTELNSTHKDPAHVDSRVCLAFPDMYDLGLSNLGLLILYSLLNARDDVWCERAYAPALDLEQILRHEKLPLFSVESKTPLRDFHLLGFTLQYELSYTNILNMLDLGGVPVFSRDRGDGDPIVIAGGPCVFNPEPLADFIDAFAIGDGEDVILDMVEAERQTRGRPRRERLEAFAAIPGVYVPALYPVKEIDGGWIVPDLEKASPIQRRIVPDLNAARFPTDYIVPYTEQAHDRVSLEVLRGCTQSCRFCQAGMTTRPVRERSLDELDRLLNETFDRTGYEEVALSSLSTCDYSQVRGLVAQSVTTARARGASVGLPSLRSDSFSVDLSDMIRTIRQTGLTFAPEAATNRMRAVINKWIADDDLVAMTGDVYARGWDAIKLYFMIGLPTETDADVEAIARLANRVHGNGRKANHRAKVNLGVSTFVPKPHTPFQWDRQINVEETHYKHFLLRRILGRNGPKFGHHDAVTSYLEGVMSRADRRAGRLLFLAWQGGARFDGWNEHLKWDVWEKALAEWGPDPDSFLAEIPRDRPLPWDHIDVQVTKQYHLDEYALSREGRLTPDCRYTKCNDCGVIHDFTKLCAGMLKTTRQGIKIERNWKRPAHLGGAAATLAGPETGIEGSRNAAERRGQGGAPVIPLLAEEPSDDWRKPDAPEAVCRLVFRYSKTGLLRFLSHLELASVVQRALRRANLPVAMTQGFHPLPKLAFATPLPTGMESVGEWADVTLTAEVSPEEFAQRLNAVLPDGLSVSHAQSRPMDGKSLMARVEAADYEVHVPLAPDAVCVNVEAFLASASHVVARDTKNGRKDVDIRLLVQALSVVPNESGAVVRMRLVDTSGKKGRPQEVLGAIIGDTAPSASIRKTATILAAA